MSYQVLARKWRPRVFADMVGQTHVLQALTNALDEGRLHHAYLFTGTRGVGKTTLARILAKCLNCEKGVSSKPCGECSACTSIDEGRFVDLIEVDAASRARVDETRDLMDNVQYAPSVGRYKVYLIDEVHMFSSHSFNALLKTLEEPPPHVKFLLATTEAKKIPVTILSRCLQFNLKLLSVEQIEQQIEKILEAENIRSDDASRRLIAVAADGSLRDGLSLLDQAISYGDGELQEEQVRAMLGTIDTRELFELLDAIADNNIRQAMQIVERIAEYNPDFDAVLAGLLSGLQAIALQQVLRQSGEHQAPGSEYDRLAARMDGEDVQLCYQIALNGRRDLPFAPDPRSGFEMILVRMLAFRPSLPVSQEQVAGGTNTGPDASSMDNAVAGSSAASVEFRPAKQNIPALSSAATPAKKTDSSNPDNWQDIIDEMALAGLVRELAGHCVLKEHTRDKVHLVLSPSQEHLINTNQKDRLEAALKTRFGDQIKVIMTVEKPASETPAQKKTRKEQERQQEAEKSVKSDPTVKLLQDTFDAVIDTKSIRPNRGI